MSDEASGATPAAAIDRADGEALFATRTAPLFSRLAELGITTSTLRHPPVFTVEESQILRGRIPGAHTKNLFLKDKKGRLFLVVAEESRAVDLKTLHARIGGQGRLSFADAGAMAESLSVEPGSVSAFCVLNDRDRAVTLVLDRDLLGHDILNCHPLTNRATTSIRRDDLLRFLEAEHHSPLVAVLDGGASFEFDAAAPDSLQRNGPNS